MTEQEKPGPKTTAKEEDAGTGTAPSGAEQPRETDDDGEKTHGAAGAVTGKEEDDGAPSPATDGADGSDDQKGGKDGGSGSNSAALVAWLALLIAIGAAGFSGYRWWAERSAADDTTGLASAVDGLETETAENAQTVAELRDRLSSLQEDLQQNLQDVQQRVQQTARQAADADELTRLQRQFGDSRDLLESLPGRMQNLEESMASLQGISAGARDAWLTAEAEYYMQLANAQSQLAGNAELAAYALELADRRIRELGDPAYTPVRRELADEIAALRAVEEVDTEGVTLTLASLADVVQSLPLDEEVTPENGARAGIDQELSGFRRAWAAVKNAFSDMVSVRRTDEQLEPLLSPEAQYFLRTNIALQLQTARLALLQGEGTIFRQSLADARAWLERYFDTDTKAVSGAMETIAELEDSTVSAELPDISSSLRLFRQQQAVAGGADEGAE
jgi:uroporphyrin-3 C-methyltransferase